MKIEETLRLQMAMGEIRKDFIKLGVSHCPIKEVQKYNPFNDQTQRAESNEWKMRMRNTWLLRGANREHLIAFKKLYLELLDTELQTGLK
jgi:hypothetical protein